MEQQAREAVAQRLTEAQPGSDSVTPPDLLHGRRPPAQAWVSEGTRKGSEGRKKGIWPSELGGRFSAHSQEERGSGKNLGPADRDVLQAGERAVVHQPPACVVRGANMGHQLASGNKQPMFRIGVLDHVPGRPARTRVATAPPIECPADHDTPEGSRPRGPPPGGQDVVHGVFAGRARVNTACVRVCENVFVCIAVCIFVCICVCICVFVRGGYRAAVRPRRSAGPPT